MGSVSVSSCRCCMFVSCVHPVAVLNSAFCMTCSLLMLVEESVVDCVIIRREIYINVSCYYNSLISVLNVLSEIHRLTEQEFPGLKPACSLIMCRSTKGYFAAYVHSVCTCVWQASYLE